MKNLHALSGKNPALCSVLASSGGGSVYRFAVSRSGENMPFLLLPSGPARPLHSTVDPEREAQRLVSSLDDEGFLVFLGLGAGFAPFRALEQSETKAVLIIDYGLRGVGELLCARDYTGLFNDPRFHLLVDPAAGEIEKYIIRSYKPALHGGIRVFPLLPRIEGEKAFNEAGEEIKRALEASSRDYSVQAWFGKRWFSNIARNLPSAEKSQALPFIEKAALAAAGPSLELRLSQMKDSGVFLIATDTSFPVLLGAGIEPGAVVSIDCQQFSFLHFLGNFPQKTMLFLDLASPHTLASLSEQSVFCAGGHPLARYISAAWRPLPYLDTSGGNVTHAAFSLAEYLGAKEIALYGADFSYPQGKTYARGTYLYPFFEKKQSRFTPVEAQHSAFLYRTPLKKKEFPGGMFSYETDSLVFYRNALEQKAAGRARTGARPAGGGGYGGGSAAEFLAAYKKKLETLRSFDESETEKRNLATTILPVAAAIRKQGVSGAGLFSETIAWCCRELEKVLNA